MCQQVLFCYEEAVKYLPSRFRMAAMQLSDYQKERTEEFRLRASHRMTVLLPEGEIYMPYYGTEPLVTAKDLSSMVDAACDHSPYACRETMRRGFLPLRGGLRLGMCGTAVIRGGQCFGLRDISSVALRLAREYPNIADQSLSELLGGGKFKSTLIISPPGGGKTTLLRDMVRGLSNGSADQNALRVCVIDERGEIAAVRQGIAQTDLGAHTDILDAIPKAIGVPMALRTMNPQVIAVDEITESEDIHAIAQAANCGSAILATIHAENAEELQQKAIYPQLCASKVFSRLLTIRSSLGEREYCVSAMP